MRISVPQAIAEIERRGLLKRNRHDQSAKIIPHVEDLLGRPLPADLAALYRENVRSIGYCSAILPVWNDWVGWRDDSSVTELLHARAVPIFSDGFGNLYGLDLTSGDATPAVYFFKHETLFADAVFAAGSSLGAFLLLLAEEVASPEASMPERWELSIDPDIDKCPRAPPIWLAD